MISWFFRRGGSRWKWGEKVILNDTSGLCIMSQYTNVYFIYDFMSYTTLDKLLQDFEGFF